MANPILNSNGQFNNANVRSILDIFGEGAMFGMLLAIILGFGLPAFHVILENTNLNPDKILIPAWLASIFVFGCCGGILNIFTHPKQA